VVGAGSVYTDDDMSCSRVARHLSPFDFENTFLTCPLKAYLPDCMLLQRRTAKRNFRSVYICVCQPFSSCHSGCAIKSQPPSHIICADFSPMKQVVIANDYAEDNETLCKLCFTCMTLSVRTIQYMQCDILVQYTNIT
jgi:hypothetical protein